MKKVVFFLCYFLSPAAALIPYLRNSASGTAEYALSVFFGVYAFIMLCNQFILASRPKRLVDALGLRGLLALHGTMPVIILSCAGIHRVLKGIIGFPLETFQATIGATVWWSLAAIIILTVLLMAQTFWLRIALVKKAKEAVYAGTGLTYKGARAMHNLTVALGISILLHVLLASSSDIGANPAGIALMVFWMVFSLGMYFAYRLRGRASKRK